MKVKICGITNLADALTAVEAGADYLGFIFYPPSKRSVDINDARKIVTALRERADCPVLVGVFVNETAERMTAVLDEVGLDLAQLSGEETASLVTDERSELYGRCYKAIRPASLAEAETAARQYFVPALLSILIDTYHPTLRGGTGETGNWAVSARLSRHLPGLMLAGGLTPENVGEAVRRVRPYAVDVASGVEAFPGKKDPDKVRAFVANAKAG
ncbi:MAG: phosphoribosylanthranilate isomerase [Chloroflexi bacterium]|nr:phosphoribosylanthranilate isomerase [Chloroflexota bacterium]